MDELDITVKHVFEPVDGVEQPKKKGKGVGGWRPGSGRKKGAKSQITIENLLTVIHDKSNGRNYEDLLVEDFLRVREAKHEHMLLKYHSLILQKVMNSLARLEVHDTGETVDEKQKVFAEALTRLLGKSKE
jgi:hypothetical protein